MEEDNIKRDDFVKWFSELNKNSYDIAGSKGANLAEIYNIGLHVPVGFVVTTQAYEFFIKKTGIQEKINELFSAIDAEDTKNVNEINQRIRNLIVSSEFPKELKDEIVEAYETLDAKEFDIQRGSPLDMLKISSEPPFVAVRSSPMEKSSEQKSSDKEQSSFLNVKGDYDLIKHIKLCFASLFTMKKSSDEISKIAVVIQKMVDADKSGIIFSRDPSYDKDDVTIESIWGLGEGLTTEKIASDHYVISRDLDIREKDISDKKIAITRNSSGTRTVVTLGPEQSVHQVLTDYEMRRLTEVAIKLEEHYGKPQNIEFATEGEDIFIVQTGPITALEKRIDDEEQGIEEIKTVESQTKTQIKVIVDSPVFAQRAAKTGLKNAGLTRMEGIIASSGKHPNYFIKNNNTSEYEQIIYSGIYEIAKYFDEMWVRTSDIRSDEYQNLEGAPEEIEANPMLGMHGIRYGLIHPEILKAELRALKKASENANTKMGILLPQVISVDEIKKVKEILNEINFTNAKIGVMVETPAAVQLIKDFCLEGINFVSIGITNLTQYILAIDKDNEEMAHLYDETHPAILRQIEFVIRTCKKNNVKTSIYGQAGGKKEMVKFLIENGIDSITTSANAASDIANLVKELENGSVAGTDKEPRQYEVKKQEEEFKKEVEETMKENECCDSELCSEERCDSELCSETQVCECNNEDAQECCSSNVETDVCEESCVECCDEEFCNSNTEVEVCEYKEPQKEVEEEIIKVEIEENNNKEIGMDEYLNEEKASAEVEDIEIEIEEENMEDENNITPMGELREEENPEQNTETYDEEESESEKKKEDFDAGPLDGLF